MTILVATCPFLAILHLAGSIALDADIHGFGWMALDGPVQSRLPSRARPSQKTFAKAQGLRRTLRRLRSGRLGV